MRGLGGYHANGRKLRGELVLCRFVAEVCLPASQPAGVRLAGEPRTS
ncbi:hypothetical protein ATKI12_1903 [Kitasatospora sp. Ki12]